MILFPIKRQYDGPKSKRRSYVSLHYSEFAQGKVEQSKRENYCVLLYVIEGHMQLRIDNMFPKELRAGDIALIPRMCQISFDVERQVRCISCSFVQHYTLSKHFVLSDLAGYLPPPAERKYECCSLVATPRIREYYQLLENYLSDDFSCGLFFELKSQELFLLLMTYYTQAELALFFLPLLGKDLDFRELVYANFRQIYTVQEFADLANMSVDTFKRRFKNTFGTTVHKWITLRKAEFIYHDLIDNRLSLPEIALKYGFSSQAYLATFCKRHLQASPFELRNRQPL